MLITILAGISFALAAPPWGWFGLAWFSWIPLWWAIDPWDIDRQGNTSPQRRGILGLVWGLGYYGISLHWVTGLHPLTWLGMSWWSSITISVGCWIFLVLWHTAPLVLWMMILGELTRRCHWTRSQTLAFGVALWCSLDWLCSYLPIYSGSLAISQSPGNLWLLYSTRWFGPFGISAAIVLVNGGLAYGLRSLLRQRARPTRNDESLTLTAATPTFATPLPWWSLAMGVFLALHGIGWGLAQESTRAEASAPPSPPLTIGVIQGNIPTRIKLTPAGIQQSLKTYRQGYEALANLGVDAVLMPEGALPMVWEGKTRLQSSLYQSIRRLGTPAWVSTFLTTEPPPGEEPNPGLTQSLIAVDSSGATTSRYNKIKLVPLGEYIPFQNLLSKILQRLSLMEGSLTPGGPGQSFNTPWGTAAIAICYEPAFSYIIQNQVKQGAQFILTVSNLDPYDTRLMAYQEALNIMRALENDRWLVAASNTGYSSLISPQGQVKWRSAPHQLVIAPVQLYPRQTQTLYSQTGDGLILCLLWGWGLSVWLLGRLRLISIP
ncbi:MAG: apolipoprotein N-acyltransferase [Prochlorotrichaceae cyanobacterium]